MTSDNRYICDGFVLVNLHQLRKPSLAQFHAFVAVDKSMVTRVPTGLLVSYVDRVREIVGGTQNNKSFCSYFVNKIFVSTDLFCLTIYPSRKSS